MLRVVGKRLNVSALVKQVSLRPYKTWQRGEKTFPLVKKSKRVNALCGVSFVVSNADMSNFSAQLRAATRLLKNKKTDIKRMVRYNGVDQVVLDFGIELTGALINSDVLPHNFLQAAADAGIDVELSHYPEPKSGR